MEMEWRDACFLSFSGSYSNEARHMTNATRQLSHLIRLMKSGNQLYRQAQQRIPDRDLQAIFVANLRDRQKIIDALQSIAGGEAGEEGTLEEEARFLVDRADLLAVLKDNQ